MTTPAAPPTMKITALAPWFGGKRTMAPDIVRELGKHTQYFEPFCGSMAVLFAKEPSQKETVNDLHGDLINLARVVQSDQAEELYERLQRVLFCDALLDDAQQHIENENLNPLERAYWYFLACWTGRNGTAGTQRIDYQLAVRWTKSGGSPTIRFRNAVESLPAWHERLRNVVILNRDAFSIIGRFEDVPETALYVDAPYVAETRGSHDNIDGGFGRYKHEFTHEGGGIFGAIDDHVRLAEELNAYTRARIVVSYYDCQRVRELYEGWTFIDYARQKHLHAQNGRGARPKEAPEVLIINGPSYTTANQPQERPA